jgi:hypothetical protein
MMGVLLFLLYGKRQGVYDSKKKKLGKGAVVPALAQEITASRQRRKT